MEIDKKTSLIKIVDLKTEAVAVEQAAPVLFEKGKTTLSLKTGPEEYFYGGGVAERPLLAQWKSNFH